MTAPRVIGRYVLYQPIAAGGMATVHLGRLASAGGFSRTVAIKRLHPHIAGDPEFVAMFLDEARIVARIQHPNVVSTLDVVCTEGELFIVMDHVLGESLSRLIRAANAKHQRIPVAIAAAVICGTLHGLHAAHEATAENGDPLQVVHRDVSPQNVLVGADGCTRVLDFGIAKAAGRSQSTRNGQIKGKIAYMPPEQVRNVGVDRRTDVYAASVVLWEMLTQRRFVEGDSDIEVAVRILEHKPARPSTLVPDIPRELDDLVMRGLSKSQEDRFATAREMAIAIEDAVPLASARKVGEWVESLADEVLKKRGQAVMDVESGSSDFSRNSLVGGDETVDAVVEVPPPDEITEISQAPTRFETTVDKPLKPQRAVPKAAIAVGAVTLIALLVGVVVITRRDDARPDAAATAPPSASVDRPVVASAAPEPSAAPPSPPEAPAASASSKPTKKKPAAQAPSCADPYVKDARGILHVKPGCL